MNLPAQTIGPFFHDALTTNPELGHLAGPEVTGERIRLRLRLLDGDGTPVTDGMLELWQADTNGNYNDPGFGGFGRLATDDDGVCLFETIRPGRVGVQAPHINVSVFARGLLGRLITRIYFSGDVSADPVLALVPAERRETLIAQFDDGRWDFDIHLQGDRETVFFDV